MSMHVLKDDKFNEKILSYVKNISFKHMYVLGRTSNNTPLRYECLIKILLW
jgi:hypothetical protein